MKNEFEDGTLFEREIKNVLISKVEIIVCGCIGAISVDDAEEAKDDAAHLIVWHVLSRYVVFYFIPDYG